MAQAYKHSKVSKLKPSLDDNERSEEMLPFLKIKSKITPILIPQVNRSSKGNNIGDSPRSMGSGSVSLEHPVVTVSYLVIKHFFSLFLSYD